MADVPKDPRQLARDILSGKISIEDLAREQARARGQSGPPVTPPPLQQRPRMQTSSSPMPQAHPMPPQQRPQQRPMQRAPMPMQRTAAPLPQRRPVPVQRPQPQRPIPQQQQRRPATAPGIRVTVPPAAVSARSGGALAPTQAQVAAQDAAVAQARMAVRKATPQARVQLMLKNRSNIREGILLAAILAPPVSMRDVW